jgi:hypothetical protein
MTRAQPSASNGGAVDWLDSLLVFVVEATVFAVQRIRKLQGQQAHYRIQLNSVWQERRMAPLPIVVKLS